MSDENQMVQHREALLRRLCLACRHYDAETDNTGLCRTEVCRP